MSNGRPAGQIRPAMPRYVTRVMPVLCWYWAWQSYVYYYVTTDLRFSVYSHNATLRLNEITVTTSVQNHAFVQNSRGFEQFPTPSKENFVIWKIWKLILLFFKHFMSLLKRCHKISNGTNWATVQWCSEPKFENVDIKTHYQNQGRRNDGRAWGEVKEFWQWKFIWNKNIFIIYVCFCSSATLTSKITTEIIEKHSEFSACTNSSNKFFHIDLDQPCNHLWYLKELAQTAKKTYDTVVKKHLRHAALPFEG